MTIFVDPDELKSSSLLPFLPDSRPCPGLEALTGADFAISRLPLAINEKTLPTHIQKRTVFVQRKHGYDVLSFDALKSSIARMKAAKIPQQQSILLFIGKDWQDDSGLLRVENSKPYGDSTYQTFLKLKAKWRYRGGVVDWLNNPEQLPIWIQAQIETLNDIETEGKREIYPNRPEPNFEPDDIWQETEEVKKEDIRYFLCAGLFGFGPKLANAVREYANQNTPRLDSWGVYYLKLLTDEDKGSKPVHKVPGWGDKRRTDLRQILGLPSGYNLSANEIETDEGKAFFKGWFAALKSFKEMVDEGHKPITAWQALMKQANEFVNLEGFFKGD